MSNAAETKQKIADALIAEEMPIDVGANQIVVFFDDYADIGNIPSIIQCAGVEFEDAVESMSLLVADGQIVIDLK